jgi:carbonic anhydrase/acetyltransferase-like protein (isoleucine patch superfamily)
MARGRAIILRTETVISPFGDHVSDAFFTSETLAQTQDRAFARLGFDVVRAATRAEIKTAIENAPPGPILVMLDRVYISEKAAKDFLRAAKTAALPAALTLSINASVRYTLPLQDVLVEGENVVHDVYLVDRATAPSDSDTMHFVRHLREHAHRVLVPKREIVAEVPLPTIGEGGKNVMLYPVTSTVVVSVEHWVHVLWLNQIAFGIRWMELIRRRPLWAIFRALSAFSTNRHKLLDALVHRGKGADIHPTAYLSASIIGKDVKIGAHATVRNSIVADGAVIGDHAVLLNSVVGPGTFVMENTFMVSTACYPGATVGNYKLQVTLIGRDAYVNAWAGFVDAKFAGEVMVTHKGKLAGTGRAFLGSVVGHRAKIAAKILIQPGRELPNDVVIVMRPDEVVSVIPEDLPEGTPLVRDKGTLVKLGEESRSR